MSTMRISTAGLYAQGLQGMLQQQARVARTQQELVSQNKLQRAADDPAAMARAQRLDHALTQLQQQDRNATLVEHRLRSQESALSDVGTQLNRARELAIQANSGGMSAEDRKSVAVELRAVRAELLAIANRDDGNGRRLFSGSRDGVIPFADNAGGVTYAGDDGHNRVEVAPDQWVADGNPGSEVFLRVRTGDGLVRGGAAAGNTGTGVLQSSAIADHSAWGGAPLRVEFTDADTWRVLDGAGTELATGAYTDGMTLQAAGVQLTLTGAPAAGDAFTIAPAPVRDIFATLDGLAAALEAPVATGTERARRDNLVGAAIGDLATAQDHMLALRSTTGSRLAALDTALDARSAGDLTLTQSLSELRDVDFAEAASRLSLQLTALEAAQKTMLSVQRMSLFDRM
ncbi:flagellar hook-associated protein FlgL [Luteimonas sp. M1R5S18]|uniref:Flagellar hook-associated protein FlgL n=1 Tax=Luteimonas rhizosphaericola TaxID=3042024 RepID=A0ABT6JL36_9GAMM|nr:flagellar hook-associated protein FlgL [Luteimonas rhizosphaericola]MDH5831392.1 flagellar hook-associated protein FlgL [Luteimonas rhizosphaericola]